MGPVQSIPFIGTQINQYVIPICLMLAVFLTLTDAYNRLRRCCGNKKTFVSGSNQNTLERVMEGQFIIDRYREEKLVSKDISAHESEIRSSEENTNDT